MSVCVLRSVTYRFLMGCWSPGSVAGQGDWAAVPLLRILLLAGGGRFHTTEQFMGAVRLTGAVLSFLGSCFDTVSNILLLFDVCLPLIWLPATVSLYMW